MQKNKYFFIINIGDYMKKYEIYINKIKTGILNINWDVTKKALAYSLAGIISATTVTKGVGPNEIVVNLRVDEGATVGKLTAVKQELRKAEALNISYAARAAEK